MGSMGVALASLGAAIAVPFAGVGSAIGVGITSQAAAEAATEDLNKFSKILVLQLPPGTQDMCELLIAFITLTQVGIMGGSADLSLIKGALHLVTCFPMGIVDWISGVLQGKAAAAGIGLAAKGPEQLGKVMIFSAVVETYAIPVLLISILSIFDITGLNIQSAYQIR